MNKLTIHIEVPVIQVQAIVDGLAAAAKKLGSQIEPIPGGGLRVVYPNAPATEHTIPKTY